MTGYSVHDINLLAWLAAFICAIPMVGYRITAIQRLAFGRIAAWHFVVASVLFVERMSIGEPYGTRMLLIIVTLLWSMKAVVYIELRHHREFVLTFWQWLGFCVCWFGMRADSFKNVPGKRYSDWCNFVWRGLIRCVAGGVFVAAAWIVAHNGFTATIEIQPWRIWTATALLLCGLSLTVHFGIFNILTGVWRYSGARCSTLFRSPLSSNSLSEFWGRRWNLAFSEMTALAIVRPLKQRPSDSMQEPVFAKIGGFLFSGLVHELAISVPVGAGFGQPTLYFAIHGFAIVIEERFSFLESRLTGRIWTIAWVLLPLPILFHRPFLKGCVWPIIGI